MRLARQYDALRRYMYLPPLPGEDESQEWLADLSRTGTVAISLVVSQMDERLTQLTFVAAQQLQYKVVMAATAVITDRSVYRPAMD
jgi:hypothetical protein